MLISINLIVCLKSSGHFLDSLHAKTVLRGEELLCSAAWSFGSLVSNV